MQPSRLAKDSVKSSTLATRGVALSLAETTCGQPYFVLAGCTSRDDATQFLPLAWRSTDRMFTPAHSKSRFLDLSSGEPVWPSGKALGW